MDKEERECIIINKIMTDTRNLIGMDEIPVITLSVSTSHYQTSVGKQWFSMK
jgi:hypothetical protein